MSVQCQFDYFWICDKQCPEQRRVGSLAQRPEFKIVGKLRPELGAQNSESGLVGNSIDFTNLWPIF